MPLISAGAVIALSAVVPVSPRLQRFIALDQDALADLQRHNGTGGSKTVKAHD
jgi:hypothetical protein